MPDRRSPARARTAAVTWNAGQHQPDSLAALIVAHDVLVHAAGQRMRFGSPLASTPGRDRKGDADVALPEPQARMARIMADRDPLPTPYRPRPGGGRARGAAQE